MQNGSRAIVAALRVTCGPARLGLTGLLLAAVHTAWCHSIEMGGVVTLASDLTDRGLLFGPRKPVLQGEVSALVDRQWSASLAASFQNDDTRHQRFVARVSRYWALSSNWQADATLSWYDYLGARSASSFRYTELGTSVAFRDLLSLGVGTRQYAGRSGSLRWALDTGLRWPIVKEWSANGSVGWAQLPTYPDRWYRYGSAGIGWQRQGWSAGLSRLGADATARSGLGNAAQSHWSAFIAKDF